MSAFGNSLLKSLRRFSIEKFEYQTFSGTKLVRRPKTIYALSTGSLPSAIAVVRLSGDQSETVLKRLTGREKLEPSRIFYTNLYDNHGKLLDRAMACFLQGPKTFTGEDSAELYLHGSRAVVNAVFATLSEIHGLESAKAGEFTKRAFFNGKMNVHEVAALSDLIHAETESQRRLSLRQVENGKYLSPIRDELVDLLAELEASIDFADEESVNFIKTEEMVEKGENILRRLNALRVSAARGCLIRTGVHIALVGRTNVGKSSIMNKLAEKDVAIVSDIPGTTRDSLQLRIQLKSMLLNFTDTAGIRETNDQLEAEGIRRSVERAREANYVLLVLDKHSVDEILEEVKFLLHRIRFNAGHQQLVVCLNKTDLTTERIDCAKIADAIQRVSGRSAIKVISTSCRDDSNIGLRQLIETLEESLSGYSAISADGEGNEVVLSSNRHVELLKHSIVEMEAFLSAMPQSETGEDDPALAADHLRKCADAVGEIAGTIVNDQVLDRLFAKFCIGK